MNNDEILEYLKRIDKHLETLVRFHYYELKKHVFKDETEKKAFELTGIRGRDEICKELHISSKTLSELWNVWFDIGLLTKQGNSYKKTME